MIEKKKFLLRNYTLGILPYPTHTYKKSSVPLRNAEKDI